MGLSNPPERDKAVVVGVVGAGDKRGGGRGSILAHFTRVELFGYPESHWVRAIVDPADPNVFSFRPEIVKGNIAGRPAN